MANLSGIKRVLFTSAIIAAFSFSAQAVDHYKIGLEGFTDNYREPDEGVHLNNHGIYGSVTGDYTHDFNESVFISVEGRASYGESKYKSVSGSSGYTPQYEGELRVKVGTNVKLAGGVISPYAGIGTRLYYDNSEGAVTSLGFGGYDRDIEQVYAPIGVTYKVPVGSWHLTPNVEYDHLLFGRVHSQIENFTGYNITNYQHDGYGVRGEMMFGKESNGYGWQFGPFVRYWNIKESDPDRHGGVSWVEPRNIRLQAGLGVKFDY